MWQKFRSFAASYLAGSATCPIDIRAFGRISSGIPLARFTGDVQCEPVADGGCRNDGATLPSGVVAAITAAGVSMMIGGILIGVRECRLLRRLIRFVGRF